MLTFVPLLLALVTGSVQERVVPEIAVTFQDSDRHAFTEAERSAIREIASRTVAEVAQLLPGLRGRIELRVAESPQVIPETGEGGMAAAPGRIDWVVDASLPDGVVAIARTHLRNTLYHELHHLVRGWTVEGGTAGRRMIDAAVSEGLATAFARDGTGWAPPWGDYPPEVEEWVQELRAVPPSAQYWHWMLQHPDGRRWIGYKAGTFIADRAMEASGRSAASLVATPTDSLLASAGLVR